jgi:NAD(P)-dependent dehydrogenase (short-subunit alcohol dehydrogenase family)
MNLAVIVAQVFDKLFKTRRASVVGHLTCTKLVHEIMKGCAKKLKPADLSKPNELLFRPFLNQYRLISTGIYRNMAITNAEEATFDELFNVNVKSAVFALKFSIQAMKKLGVRGSILVNSSVAGTCAKRHHAESSLYCGTKAAVDILTDYGAIEAAEAGMIYCG